MRIRFLIALSALICVGSKTTLADSSVQFSGMSPSQLKLQALKFLLIGIIFQPIEGKTTVDIDLTIERCCEVGSNFATKSSDCYQSYQPTNEIHHDYRKLCRNNFIYCCKARKSSLDCEDGKRAALYHRNKTAAESDQFMLCYQACKVGQSISQLEGKCTQPVKTSSDRIRNECCENYFPNNAIEEETPEAQLTDSNENVDKSDEDESDPYCDNDHDLDSCDCAEGWQLIKSEHKCIRLPPPQPLTHWNIPIAPPRCPEGFKFDEQNKCVDIDECKERNSCGETEICRNFEGSYTCTECPRGYEKGASNNCEDINECVKETLCEESDICVNTPGSYTCEPVPCEDGFEFNQGTGKCEDVNECDNKYSCGSFARCVNTKGSYDCECAKGFKFDWRSKYCEDVDECQKVNACPETKECINLRGSFDCRDKACGSGSIFNKRTKKCDDINECTSFRSPCGRSQRCVNLQGSYDCQCSVGYQKDEENSKACRDTDECTERPEICDQRCFNLAGSYRCGCHKGYKLGTDNRTCIHLDECAMYGNQHCQYKCRNTRESYECICPKGFTNEGRHQCADVNECTQNMCGDMKQCVNTYGSFSCIPKQCDSGYVFKDGHCFLDDLKKCRTKRNESSKNLCRIPAGYLLTFGAIKANSSVHADGNVLTTVKSIGKIIASPIIKWVRVHSRDPRVVPADQSFFKFEKRNNTTDFDLKMMRPIDGPQQIEIDVWKYTTRAYYKGNVFNHIEGYRLFIVVSDHPCNLK